ncbi:2,3-bisphosphoglycerate-dependent phosphoglycerate mutase [Aeromicrobium sp.]|uniref:2,3-bisphosphoglycerate-dependent phosphoglycerate mutase n=1 Tax=Aeromicrobium sp. TaxID=1871063 RepID=UPI0019936A3F|nr:2,3-bisphosphoglycerate-dependent phosphoglycerate mutase [Aeromicrobium sp.]MBC7632157.1 2,3-bisphosphoglycerate-dependent phosphoglycerate mutase [Aeromicrobium sp.]
MLILVRHGESAWNADDRFTGWADVALTAAGRQEARSAGSWLRSEGIVPTSAHTSLLTRALGTTDLVLDACCGSDVPVLRTDRLNERHYGILQGMSRAAAAERYGAARVARWRRGIHDRPPADAAGRAESLADVRLRLRPYLDDELLPALDAGQTVLVVSHGNTLRMLIQALERLSDVEAAGLELRTGGVRVIGQPRVGRSGRDARHVRRL